jgi:hypothetical protein
VLVDDASAGAGAVGRLVAPGRVDDELHAPARITTATRMAAPVATTSAGRTFPDGRPWRARRRNLSLAATGFMPVPRSGNAPG